MKHNIEKFQEMKNNLRPLFSKEEIQAKVKELADQINQDFGENEVLYIICVLKGASFFATDLTRHLKMPVQLDFIRLSSYGDSSVSSGVVKAVDLSLPDLQGENVLIVEDIIDTGRTINFLTIYLKEQLNIPNVEFVTLFDKPCRREINCDVKYKGFQIEDKFIVGYGIDYAGYFRNLEYVGYVE